MNHTWQVPTRVCFGAGRAATVGEEAAALGSSPALLVDAGIRDSSAVSAALRALAGWSVPQAVLVPVPPSPTLDRAESVAESVGAAGCDVVIGVGGGSTMDLAKIVALAAVNPGLLGDERWRTDRVLVLPDTEAAGLRPGLPTLLLPTTCATGSELNAVAALTHEGRKRLLTSGLLVPTTSLVDQRLTATLSAAQLVAGGVETFGRIACPYLVPGDTLPTTDTLAETLAAQCLSATDAVHERAGDERARGDLGWLVSVSATQLAGLGRDDWGHVLWYLQDGVAARAGTGKGPAMAALLPAYLAAIRAADAFGARLGAPGRLDRLEAALASLHGHGAARLEDALAARLSRWGMPTSLHELGLSERDGAEIAEDTARWWGGTGRLAGATPEEFGDFYARAWRGQTRGRVRGLARGPARGPTPGGSPETPAGRSADGQVREKVTTK